MPFPEFAPDLDEKFKFASFGLTRLNSESIFSLQVTNSSLTFTSPSFVSGSLVPQTTNPQTFDVYSVVSITGAGGNPFTLNSNGTYNYQIPTPLPTTNLVLTYTVTRGTKTTTATLTLMFNPFPLCTIEDPNTSLYNLKIYHSGSTAVSSVNTFEGVTYPRAPLSGSNIGNAYRVGLSQAYKEFRWITGSATTPVGGVLFRTPAANLLASVTHNAGTSYVTLNTTGGSRVFSLSTAIAPNTLVTMNHGATIQTNGSDFIMTVAGSPVVLSAATAGFGFTNAGSTELAFNDRQAIGCFLAKV